MVTRQNPGTAASHNCVTFGHTRRTLRCHIHRQQPSSLATVLYQPPCYSRFHEMATTVSAQFIETLCDKLKASLDLNAKLRTGAGQASLDKQMFNMVSGPTSEKSAHFSHWIQIMDAHISTLTCHTTILEQLLETAEAEQKEPAVTELKRAVDRARGILDDAHMAKNLMTEDKKIQREENDPMGQMKKSEESKSDQKASNEHNAETNKQSATDGEDEKFFDASQRCGCDLSESQQTHGGNSETTTTTPKSKHHLSTSDQQPTSTIPKRHKPDTEVSEQTQKRKRDRLSSDSTTLGITNPKKTKPNLPEYERRYLTDDEYDALYPPTQPEEPTEDISEEVERIITARQRIEEWQRRRDNGQIEKRKVDEDGEFEQPMEEAGMVGKKRRMGEHEQWMESSARAEPSLGVGNTKSGENDGEANGVGNRVKRGWEGQKSEEHSLKRAKTVHGRA
jgi:hypothetical protein